MLEAVRVTKLRVLGVVHAKLGAALPRTAANKKKMFRIRIANRKGWSSV
jgi:hypothetical protein